MEISALAIDQSLDSSKVKCICVSNCQYSSFCLLAKVAPDKLTAYMGFVQLAALESVPGCTGRCEGKARCQKNTMTIICTSSLRATTIGSIFYYPIFEAQHEAPSNSGSDRMRFLVERY